MKAINLTFLLFIITFLVGCATGQERFVKTNSASQIGCMPEEVKVTEFKNETLTFQTWVATCKGEKYFCQRSPESEYSFKTKCSQLK